MFYRLIKMSNKWMGLKVDLEEDLENIEEFANCGVVVIADELEMFCDELGIDMDDIELVE